MTDIAKAPLDAINSLDMAILQDPHPYMERLRKEAPVYRDPHTGFVSVATFDLIREVCAQPNRFSNGFSEVLRKGARQEIDPEEQAAQNALIPGVETLLTADPPVHTRYRKLAMKAFTMKRVEAMSPHVSAVVEELACTVAPLGTCEFKSAFANHLPMIVIADALGVPRSDMDMFRIWSDAFITRMNGLAGKEARVGAAGRIGEYQQYFLERIAEKRTAPTDDVISDLVHADLSEDGDARKMTDAELLSIFQQLLVAGNETTAHSLTAGMFYLISNPGLEDLLRSQPAIVPNFVEETLRYLSPTNNMYRVATEDCEIGGVPVNKGDLILLRYGSGNRDNAVFADGDRFDVRRENAKEHLAFGAGIHHCIGAQLARREMTIAWPILLRRMHDFRFAAGRNSFMYLPTILMRGVSELHIAYQAS
ncbi:MAG: cytochrome P450 [Phenylobacterium sp.]